MIIYIGISKDIPDRTAKTTIKNKVKKSIVLWATFLYGRNIKTSPANTKLRQAADNGKTKNPSRVKLEANTGLRKGIKIAT